MEDDMVKFIIGSGKNADVESVMENVNNYINLKDTNGIENSGQRYLVKKSYDELIENATRINENYRLEINKPINVIGRFSRLKRFIMKLVRKTVRWYMNDVALQQTEINALLTRYINQVNNVLGEMNQEIIQLQKRVKELENEKESR